MNITEANATNVVLRELISRVGPPARRRTPVRTETVLAAAELADRANKALGAGLRGEDVREALS